MTMVDCLLRDLICRMFGHDWYSPINGPTTYCARCGATKSLEGGLHGRRHDGQRMAR